MVDIPVSADVVTGFISAVLLFSVEKLMLVCWGVWQLLSVS